MDMSKEAIEKIESLVNEGRTVTVGEMVYSAKDLKPVLFEPKVDSITIHSLRGFCDYINSKFDMESAKDDLMVIVDNIDSVRLVSHIAGVKKQREQFMSAVIDKELETFPFGNFMSQEEFAIRFRSSFAKKEKDDTDYILQYVSKLAGGTSVDLEDDGVTQNVGVKKGVSGVNVERKNVKPIVKLSPYRTFREIVQPESEFLFRVRMDGNNIPTAALFEADGGAWRSDAMKTIAEYIAENCGDIKIIA